MSAATTLLAGFVAATIRVSTPLLLTATGDMVSERGGVINLGIEGAMLCGALGAALGATAAGPVAGLAVGLVAGLLVTALFSAFAVGARTDQIITGTAVTIASVGLTGVVYRKAYGAGGVGLTLPTLTASWLGVPVISWVAWLLVPVAWWVLFRTRWGLMLRASGENQAAALAAGVPLGWVQASGTLLGGALAGLGGATLVLAQVGTFAERMTAGRGFIAIAIVVLGRWRPFGVLGAALLFGAAEATRFLLQAMGLDVAYQWFQMLPYLLALVALAGVVGRAKAPAELGVSRKR